MTTEDFFIYFIIACFIVVLIWGLRWIFQIFCSTNSIQSPDQIPDRSQRRTRHTRIRRSDLLPPPPPPYSWQPDQNQEEQRIPRISVYTVTIGDHSDVPDDKLPKYEEIFPSGKKYFQTFFFFVDSLEK